MNTIRKPIPTHTTIQASGSTASVADLAARSARRAQQRRRRILGVSAF